MKVQSGVATIVYQQFNFRLFGSSFTLGFVFFVCSHRIYVSQMRYINQEKSEKR